MEELNIIFHMEEFPLARLRAIEEDFVARQLSERMVRVKEFPGYFYGYDHYFMAMGSGPTPERLLKVMLKVDMTIGEIQRYLQMSTKSKRGMGDDLLWLTVEEWKIVDKLFQDLIFGAETVSTMGNTVVQDGSSRTSRDRSVAAASPGRAAVYDAFVVLTALLLSALFQYLIGPLDKGGTKVHSSGSLEFRWKYISIVLLLGAYIWIKFRDGAPKSLLNPSLDKPWKGIRRSRVLESGVKVYYGNFEPRFKPPSSDYISVGSYKDQWDAWIMYQLLAFCYDKFVPGKLELLRDGSAFYHIPCITEEERRLDPMPKRVWAKKKAEDNFKEYKRAVESLRLESRSDPADCPNAGGVDSGRLVAEAQPSRHGNQNDDVDTGTQGMQDHVPDTSVSYDFEVSDAFLTEPLDQELEEFPRLRSRSDPDCLDAGGVDSGRLVAEAQPSRHGNQNDDVYTVTAGMQPDISVSEDIGLVPDAILTEIAGGADCPEAGAQPFWFGNQSHDLEPVHPSSFSPNVDTVSPGMHGSVGAITSSDHVVGDANWVEGPAEQPQEPQFQQQSLQESQADNVLPDSLLSILRQVKELKACRQPLSQSQFQQFRFELDKQLHQIQIQQLQSQISELRKDLENERRRKRICTCLNSET